MATIAPRDSAARHVPDGPPPHKRAVRVNVFELATNNIGSHQLTPIFPYWDDGAIVPCLTIGVGHRDLVPFQFSHSNAVDETILYLAAEGATTKTGQIMKLSPVHGVNMFLKDPFDPESYSIALLTIRMLSGPVQQEGFSIRCASCNEIVYQREFNVKAGPTHQHYPEFHALRYYSECCEEFNSSEQRRTCPKCGTVQAEFPLKQMGWWRHVENVEVANKGRAALEALAAEAVGGA
jgi:hypothetical protein